MTFVQVKRPLIFPKLKNGADGSSWAILHLTDTNFQLTWLYQSKNLRYTTSLIKVTFRWSSPDDHLKTSLPNHIQKALLFNNTGWRRGMLKLASSLLPAKNNWQGLEPLSRVSLTTLLRHLPIKEPRQYLRFQVAQKLKISARSSNSEKIGEQDKPQS